MAKRKRFFQKRQTVDSEPAEIENVSENIQPTQDDIVKKYEKKKEIENKETKDASTSSFKPTGIIKYVYLIAFFALLAGIMAPIFDPYESQALIENSYKGIDILFVGLVGGILIFKSTRSIENRMTKLMIGFALLIICLVFMAEFADNSFFSDVKSSVFINM